MKKIILILSLLLSVNSQARVANNVFRQDPTGNLVNWGSINLASPDAVSGILGVINGGLGLSSLCPLNQAPLSNGSGYVCASFSAFNYLSSNTSVYGGTFSTLSFTGANNAI